MEKTKSKKKTKEDIEGDKYDEYVKKLTIVIKKRLDANRQLKNIGKLKARQFFKISKVVDDLVDECDISRETYFEKNRYDDGMGDKLMDYADNIVGKVSDKEFERLNEGD